MRDQYRVTARDLTRQCSDDPFNFKTTAELEPLDSIIGQRRAVEAIDFGLNMKRPGYHIFITGYEGTGKSTITRDILKAHASRQKTPEDLCLVNNFDDQYCPGSMEMPTGSAVFFSRHMNQLIETLNAALPQLIETPAFQEKQTQIKNAYAEQQQQVFHQLETAAEELGIGIVQTEKGYQPIPVENGQPVSAELFQGYDPDKKKKIEAGLLQIRAQMPHTLKQIRSLVKEMQGQLWELNTQMAGTLIAEEMDNLFGDFKDRPRVRDFLEATKADMIENIALMLRTVLSGGGKEGTQEEQTGFLERRYQVNVLVDRRGESGAPVIFEPNPTFQNLFGKIEKFPVRSGFATDFTMVQAGSILKANKGYLILEIASVLRDPLVWETLKSTLENRKVYIEDPPGQAGMFVASLKPEPIPLDVKVLLLGSYEIFRTLQRADPKFNKIFQVRADFDHEVTLTREILIYYARFIAGVCASENLMPFSPCGVSAVVEYGNRMAEDKRKLSLRFGRILGVLREADYWARKENATLVEKNHVLRSLSEYRFRHNLHEEKVQEGYDDHSILLDVSGEKVGQVNALAVYQIGEIAFGRPARITAESYMGKPGIINVEREAQLSGQTHDKGMMIISGYLGRMFAQTYPLSVSISITFEQSYSGIDGDSASSTELYAVLSSLSGYPIRQGIAVTGSVNQKGEIQAIGGVNEKIEGFYDVCVKRGLTGDQGVMIPSSNVKNLMLRKDVAAAVEKRKFHIFQVADIEQGVEVLTGIVAGKPDENFVFPENSLFGAAQAKLKRFHKRSIAFSS